MSNPRTSFPVSRSQGMGNREPCANALANHDLLSPGPLEPNRGFGKQKSDRASVWDATDRPAASLVASLKIERLYQPQSTAMEALVDVLHLLLVNETESPESPTLLDPNRLAFRARPCEECV
jgi:hypothetical protein